MNFVDWYTDTADIWRVTEEKEGALTVQKRVEVNAGVPCRIFQAQDAPVNPSQTAASVREVQMLMCNNSVDIRPGDELLIHRGGALGKTSPPMRAFAGEPTPFFEPFGAVIPGLAHQEIPLLSQERT